MVFKFFAAKVPFKTTEIEQANAELQKNRNARLVQTNAVLGTNA